jgi:hypothetical protein
MMKKSGTSGLSFARKKNKKLSEKGLTDSSPSVIL